MSTKPVNRTLVLRGLLAATCLLVVLVLGSLQVAYAAPGPDRGENIHQHSPYRQHDSRYGYADDTVSAAVVPPSNAALDFDGSNDIVDIGDIGVLNGVTQYTIEAWVKFDTFSTYSTVFAKRVADGDRSAMLQAWNSSGEIAVAVNGGYGYTSAPLSTGTWYHIAVVYDGTQATDADRLKLYVDGSPKSLTFLGTVPTTTTSTSSRFALGAEYNGTTPIDSGSPIVVPFDGTIDQVRIWNFPRTQPQIQADKYIELTGSETGLEIYYDFNQGIPGGDNPGLITLNDRAGTAQNGTLWNFALTGPSSNWVPGAFFVHENYLPMVLRND